ncbi:MAG: nucleotidyltransferase family protein [Prevotellaceae bacterium]|nr:nucleotidyltransferase family protein [Prevotellaceae bacterium]
MTTNDRELFFSLIRVATGSESALPYAPSKEEWSRLHTEAQRQALLGVLYVGVERLPQGQLPPKATRLLWYTEAERISEANKRLDEASALVSRRLREEGFRNAILKGQGNALLYPSPSRRQPGDIDVWLEGGREKVISYVLSLFPGERVQWLELDFPVLRDIPVEAHTAPSVLFCPKDNQRLQAFYREREEETFTNETPLASGTVCLPRWEMNAVFQLTHIYRHLFFEGVGLRQVMDYHYLLLSPEATAERRQAVREHAKRMHLTRFTGALMWVLREVFHLEESLLLTAPDQREGSFLLQEIMLAGNFGHDDERNKPKASRWGNFWQITLRNTRFLAHYPREVLWNPVYRLRQYAWRKRRGYK